MKPSPRGETMKKTFLQSCIFLIVFILCTPKADAQLSYSEFHAESDPSRKAASGLELWNYYLRNDLDSLKILGVELLLFAAEEGHPFCKAVGHHVLGSYLIRRGEIKKGLYHLNEAKNYYTRREDYDQLTIAYNEMGNARYLEGKYHEAIKMYLSSLKYGGLAPDLTSAFSAKIGLGKAYIASGDTVVGLKTIHEYKDQVLNFRKFESAADAYAYLGEVEMDRNTTLSQEYFKKSVIYSVKSKSLAHLSHAYNNTAILFFNLGATDSSVHYFQKALDIRLKMDHKKAVVESYYNFGFLYKELGELKKALGYFEKSAELARVNGYKGDQRDALLEAKSICEELNLYRLQEIVDEITRLEKEMELDQSDDKEIIDYAEKVIRESKMNEDQPADKGKGNGNLIWWLLGGGLLLILLFWFFKKRA